MTAQMQGCCRSCCVLDLSASTLFSTGENGELCCTSFGCMRRTYQLHSDEAQVFEKGRSNSGESELIQCRSHAKHPYFATTDRGSRRTVRDCLTIEAHVTTHRLYLSHKRQPCVLEHRFWMGSYVALPASAARTENCEGRFCMSECPAYKIRLERARSHHSTQSR